MTPRTEAGGGKFGYLNHFEELGGQNFGSHRTHQEVGGGKFGSFNHCQELDGQNSGSCSTHQEVGAGKFGSSTKMRNSVDRILAPAAHIRRSAEGNLVPNHFEELGGQNFGSRRTHQEVGRGKFGTESL